MPMMRVQVDTDRATAKRVVELHRAGRAHKESRDAARDEVWRRGRTPAAEPVFVGVAYRTKLLYDVEVYPEVSVDGSGGR